MSHNRTDVSKPQRGPRWPKSEKSPKTRPFPSLFYTMLQRPLMFCFTFLLLFILSHHSALVHASTTPQIPTQAPKLVSTSSDPFSLDPLPYEIDALAPHISKETLEYHYGKHHAAYVNNLNKYALFRPPTTFSWTDTVIFRIYSLVRGSELADLTLEELIMTTKGAIFNNAAQVSPRGLG